ncbi:MAG: SDR family oxidoreductase [Anaerolineae bacterium]|nr:SDR family oxidoreductase [Anaerolineae bacterium]
MDLGLKDLRVLVTASSRGLGAATAHQFSLEGARVAICSRSQQSIEATAAWIAEQSGGQVIPLVGDVADPESASALVAQAAATLGGLDILVTNAGGPPAGAFTTLNTETWAAATNLTLMSTVTLIQAALPYLRASQNAAILTITSYSAKQPIPNLVLSNSLRAAVIGLTKTLAQELGPGGIRVNSIMPGWTRTERVVELMQARAAQNKTTPDAEIARQTADIPLQRMAEPSEFARAAVFLCSPAASYIHGAMVPVDGGAIQAAL